jgi:superoxide dismutase, Fe-Mn family
MNYIGLRLTSASALSRLKPRWSKRNYHQLEKLPYPIENGLGDFLPPDALKVVAIDYQAGLLQQLNEELRGTLRHEYSELHLMTTHSKRGTHSIYYADSDRRVSI